MAWIDDKDTPKLIKINETTVVVNCPNEKRKLWFCYQNCYINWFVMGQNMGCGNTTSITINNADDNAQEHSHSLYQRAVRVLQHYNFIFITEQFTNQRYIEKIEALFGVPWVGYQGAFCFKQSQWANEKNPLSEMDLKTYSDILTVRNKADIKLYKYFTDCANQPGFVDELPNHNIFQSA